MAEMEEFKIFTVKVVGIVAVKATDSTDAIAKATTFFTTTGKNLDWTAVEQTAIGEKEN